jgi:hypothetical protein
VFYTVCFDESTSTTLYSKSFIDGKSFSEGLGESNKPRPNKFQDQGYFPFNVDLVCTYISVLKKHKCVLYSHRHTQEKRRK